MARCSRHPKCIQTHGHGGDFHVGEEVEPGAEPVRRYLYPTAEARARVLARLGPGPYVGVAGDDAMSEEDRLAMKRAGLDDLMKELE